MHELGPRIGKHQVLDLRSGFIEYVPRTAGIELRSLATKASHALFDYGRDESESKVPRLVQRSSISGPDETAGSS